MEKSDFKDSGAFSDSRDGNFRTADQEQKQQHQPLDHQIPPQNQNLKGPTYQYQLNSSTHFEDPSLIEDDYESLDKRIELLEADPVWNHERSQMTLKPNCPNNAFAPQHQNLPEAHYNNVFEAEKSQNSAELQVSSSKVKNDELKQMCPLCEKMDSLKHRYAIFMCHRCVSHLQYILKRFEDGNRLYNICKDATCNNCCGCRIKKGFEAGMDFSKARLKITLKDLFPSVSLPPLVLKAKQIHQKKQNENCMVCGNEQASEYIEMRRKTGRTVVICKSCKLFFKTSSSPTCNQKGYRWKCNSKNCEIRHNPMASTQNHCCYCRFQKCREIGMSWKRLGAENQHSESSEDSDIEILEEEAPEAQNAENPEFIGYKVQNPEDISLF